MGQRKKIYNKSLEICAFGRLQEYKNNGSAYYPVYEEDESGNNGTDERFTIEQAVSCDMDSKQVFEGDILKRLKKDGTPYKGVKVVPSVLAHSQHLKIFYSESIVIGNVNETPELID